MDTHQTRKLPAWRYSLADLPENAVLEILSRLPLKALLSCKCACKYFNKLASPSAHFNSLYSPRATQALVLRFQVKPDQPTPYLHMFDPEADLPRGRHGLDFATKFRFDLPKVSDACSLTLKNSCNGLLYLSGAIDNDPNSVIINPLTNEYVTLPHWDIDRRRGTRVQLLGFGAVSNRYKVMRIFQTSSIEPLGIQVHEVGSGSWRDVEIETECYLGPDDHFTSATYLDGAAYMTWNSQESTKLVYFDFDEEKIGEISLPIVLAFSNCIASCGVLGDRLCVSFNIYKGHCDWQRLDLWVMRKRGGGGEFWSEEFSIDRTVGPMFGHSFYHIRPLRVLDNGKILMFSGGHCLFCYDPCNKIMKFVGLGLEQVEPLMEPVNFTPSFVPLKDHLSIGEFMVKRA